MSGDRQVTASAVAWHTARLKAYTTAFVGMFGLCLIACWLLLSPFEGTDGALPKWANWIALTVAFAGGAALTKPAGNMMLRGRIRETTCPACNTALALQKRREVLDQRQVVASGRDGVQEWHNEYVKADALRCTACGYVQHGKRRIVRERA